MFDPERFRGRRVTVMGLGLFGGGLAVTRFLHRLGARVTVTDLRAEEALKASLAALGTHDIRLVLGRHDEADFTDADTVVANPAVPPSSPFLALARAAGVEIETETNLFFQACPSRWIVGVTGSNGKSTTTSMAGAMLAASGFVTRVGGNIGRPLIEEVFDIGPEDRVVLELSSFQLEDLDRLRASPPAAAITNITPNHLDRHGTLEAYVDAKAGIFRHQGPDGFTALNADDPASVALASRVPGRLGWFSLESEIPEGWLLKGDSLVERRDGRDHLLLEAGEIPVPGRFNAANVLAAAAVSRAAGATAEGIRAGVKGYRPLPHRLERVAERRGAAWYNDSIATTPESVLAALSAFAGGIVLIAGGYDKKIPLEAMARAAAARARAVVLLGAVASQLEAEIRAAGGQAQVARAASLEEAVLLASELCRKGDAVLLSPGAASYDMFTNFQERGDRFRALVLALPE